MSEAWEVAFALAWHSYLARTTPVGAVIVNASGEVVAQGRGRHLEPPTSDQQLAHSRIAHAEVNALALLPPDQRYEDHTLLTTLEPCCMCVGAALQSTIVKVRFAGCDPYAGASRIVIDTPQARRRPLIVTGPLPGIRGRFAELIHMRWLLDVGAAAPVLAEHEWAMPDLYQAAARPSTAMLFRKLARHSATAAEALDASHDLLPA